MPRPRRSVAGLCIAVIAVTAFLPGLWALDYALFEPEWVLLPENPPAELCVTATASDEQPIPFLSLRPSRAPPAHSLA